MEKINIPPDLCHISHQLSRLGRFVFHLSSDIRCVDEINIVENSVLDRTGETILKHEGYKPCFIQVGFLLTAVQSSAFPLSTCPLQIMIKSSIKMFVEFMQSVCTVSFYSMGGWLSHFTNRKGEIVAYFQFIILGYDVSLNGTTLIVLSET